MIGFGYSASIALPMGRVAGFEATKERWKKQPCVPKIGSRDRPFLSACACVGRVGFCFSFPACRGLATGISHRLQLELFNMDALLSVA